ncbi:MAG: pyruvate, water dikinase, partial [SAR324 cluster bacterium]|nr:pyruvate, water dikinase [SAR324 cluster bacterium]
QKADQRLVVRSSAVGEDDLGKSHAGQFHSVINIHPDEIFVAFQRVLASRFNRLPRQADFSRKGFERELPMAVGVQVLVRAKSAGVAYSIDPVNPANNSILISSVYGLGIPVVEGTMHSDFFQVSRIDPTHILDRKIAVKDKMIVPAISTGTETVSVPTELQAKSSLEDDQVRKIAELAFVLERYMKRPQDIEWAIDESGEVIVLQCRPLVVSQKEMVPTDTLPELLQHYKLILKNQGLVANRGIAIGKVCLVTEDTTPEDFPIGGIAVAHFASPRLTRIFHKTAAILTDLGSSTGHMATVAREFGIPAIVGMENVTQILHEGMEITIDAYENEIYDGIINELLEYESAGKDVFIELPEFIILRRILKNIASLRMIDPDHENFTAGNCRTYHDIIRFAHEKAIYELINSNTASKKFSGVTSREVMLPIPLGLMAIDIGGGLIEPQALGQKISLDDIRSVPTRALLEGLTLPNVWNTDPVSLNFSDFMSSMTRKSVDDTRMSYQGRNLAVISDVYMNLSLRLGYHFNVVDAYLSENINDNYIYFRFVGGVTETDRRNRRALTIKLILEQLDFNVIVQGDLVIGKNKSRTLTDLRPIMVQMGKLIGFTRQLDVRMTSYESITLQSQQFFSNTWSEPDGQGTQT